MRLRLAWGGMILLIAFATAPADAGPRRDGLRLASLNMPEAVPQAALPGVAVPGGRVGLGFYQTSPKRGFNANVREAVDPPRYRKAPGVGLKLAF